MLPNFLIIGSMKSGTTTLYHLLKSHPDIFMADNKEPQYFSDDRKFSKGTEWYESLFNNYNNEKAIGEASTNYTKHPSFKNVPERIKKIIPGAKLIYVLRDPVDRIYSHFVHNYYMGRIENDIEQAINNDAHYINVSKYYYQIEQYLKYFDKDDIKIILLDDLRDSPMETVVDTYGFLGVDDTHKPQGLGEHKHASDNKMGQSGTLMNLIRKVPFYHSISNNMPEGAKRFLNAFVRKKVEPPLKLDAKLRKRLQQELSSDILLLQEYLGRDLTHWLR